MHLMKTGALIRASVVAGAVMGEVVWLVTRSVGGNVGVDALIRLVIGAVVGVVIYFALLAAMGAPEVDALRRRLSSAPATTSH